MAVIRRIDTIGIKTILKKGEFGLDLVPGGDKGRVYVGTGTENIPLARLDELGGTIATATAGQTDITVVGSGSMILRVDGVVQTEGTDYTIIDATTIQMVVPFVGGEEIAVIDTSDIATAIENLQILQQANDEALAYAIALG